MLFEKVLVLFNALVAPRQYIPRMGFGGDANAAVVFAVFTGGVHGPGGGGGGGMIITSGGLAASNRNGGAFGTTETSAFEWGATAGTIGATPVNSAKLSQVAGVRSGVECAALKSVVPGMGAPQ